MLKVRMLFIRSCKWVGFARSVYTDIHFVDDVTDGNMYSTYFVLCVVMLALKQCLLAIHRVAITPRQNELCSEMCCSYFYNCSIV